METTETQNLSVDELKAAIKSAWKKHEELAKQELAEPLYWLREKLRAQGARNDISDRDRGFGLWVEEHLDISRRTADRWCEWYAIQAGLKPLDTCPKVDPSDVEVWDDILEQHKGHQQIAFNYWVKTATHSQFQKALTRIQNKFGLKDKKEALVRGVIYAATVITTASETRHDRKRTSARRVGRVESHRNGRRTSMGATANSSRKNG